MSLNNTSLKEAPVVMFAVVVVAATAEEKVKISQTSV